MTIPNTFGRRARLSVLLAAGASLAACATVEPRYASRADGAAPPRPAGGERKIGKPYQVGGIWYVPREQPNYNETGIASWYGQAFHQKATANGELFDMNAVSAAHTTLPLPSMVEVTNLDNGRRLVVRVNDRGPFVDNRIIDLSQEAARQLGYDRKGLANVRVRYLGPAPLLGPSAGVRYAGAGKASPARVASATATVPAQSPAARAGYDPVVELAAGGPSRPTSASASFADLPPAPVTGSEISSAPIAAAPLAPLQPVAANPLPPLAAAPVAAPAFTSTPTAPGLRVQAGAFSSQANAQQAVARLSPAGPAVIEPLQRGDGLTLYRVVLPAPADEAAAYELRDRVAEIGFTDARVVRAF